MNFDDKYVLILDDEPYAMKQSYKSITNFVTPKHVFCAKSALEAIKIMEGEKIDLAFIDIEMPDTNGFTVVEYIASNFINTKYVFLTGHTEFGAKSYDYEPLDFLIKPIDIIRLKKTFERFDKSLIHEEVQDNLVAVDTGTGFILLSPTDICYIAKENRKILIQCDNQSYKVNSSLDELEIIFSDYGFIRTHQSFLVPLSRIESVEHSRFGNTYSAKLNSGQLIPVSRNRYGKLRDYLFSRGIKFI